MEEGAEDVLKNSFLIEGNKILLVKSVYITLLSFDLEQLKQASIHDTNEKIDSISCCISCFQPTESSYLINVYLVESDGDDMKESDDD